MRWPSPSSVAGQLGIVVEGVGRIPVLEAVENQADEIARHGVTACLHAVSGDI